MSREAADLIDVVDEVLDHLGSMLRRTSAAMPATTSIAIADSAPSRTETKIVIRRCSPREQARASGLARVADDYDFAIQTKPRYGGVSLPHRRLK